MTTTTEIIVPLHHIHSSPDNPRDEAGDLGELWASIREEGLVQALIVRPSPKETTFMCSCPRGACPGHYILEDGYRRWSAMRLGGGKEARCYLRDAPLTAADATKRTLITSLVTDIHNKSLNPIERAKAYGRLRDEFGLNQKQIAERVGLTDSTVNMYLALLELDQGTQRRVAKKEGEPGKLRVADAYKAVVNARRRARRKKGQKPMAPVWEPDHFTRNHQLARKAEVMCDARAHTNRRRYGRSAGFKGACGQCWETVIRSDQSIVLRVEYEELLGQKLPDIRPVMTSGTRRENGRAPTPEATFKEPAPQETT